MANIKQTIDDNIYQNGQQRITGVVMNSVLKAMVDDYDGKLSELATKGYKFGGVVTPNDTPIDTDIAMAYIASQNGTYPNFGNLVINNEIAAFIKGGEQPTPPPTPESPNLLHLDNLIGGKYYGANGQLLDSSSWSASQLMPIQGGHSYKFVTLENGQWVSRSNIWFATFDADGNNTTPTGEGTHHITTEGAFIDTTENDAFIGVSGYTTEFRENETMVVDVTYTPTEYIPPSGGDSELQNLLFIDTMEENKYVDSDGVVKGANEWSVSQLIRIKGGEEYKVVALVNGTWQRRPSVWFATYDADGVNTTPPGADNHITNLDGTKDIPTQIADKYIRVSYANANIGTNPMVVLRTANPTHYIEPSEYIDPIPPTPIDTWEKIVIYNLGLKQDKLVAGANVSIVGNVISASGGGDFSSMAQMILPSKLVFMQNKEMDIMYNNILYRADADKLGFKRLGSSTLYGYAEGDRFRIKHPNVGYGSASLNMQLVSDCNPFVAPSAQTNIIEKSFDYSSISTSQGSGQSKKVLIIGDSLTANGKYTKELMTMFASDSMNVEFIGTMGYDGIFDDGSGNIRKNDGLGADGKGTILVSNYHFGTDGNVYNSSNVLQYFPSGVPMKLYHEGHGGWTANKFCSVQTYKGYFNSFWNPSTNKFDFSYYMSQYAIKHPSVTSVDYVFINLGVNDVASAEHSPFPLTETHLESVIGYYNEMIASIRAFNSNIKIFIGLPIEQSTPQFALDINGLPRVDCSYSPRLEKARILMLISRLLQEYDNRVDDGFSVVPLYCVIDTDRDFPSTEKPICDRDSTLVPYVTDVIHPKEQGYNKMADVLFTYIKYATTL